MDDKTKLDIIKLDLGANGFDRIVSIIDDQWGTIELQQYLQDLLYDTRDGERNGFPQHVAEDIIQIILMNDKVLSQKEAAIERPPEKHIVKNGWKIPKSMIKSERNRKNSQ